MSLTKAILFENLQSVKQWLHKENDVEFIDEYGFTPLIEAVIANKLDIVELLLNKGALVDSTDSTGRTALHWAVDNHNLALCQLLLSKGANPNSYTYSGQPLLILPFLRQQTELKKLLYAHQAQLSFAQDFIQVKLLGHRYGLSGEADIVNPKGEFLPVSYEGFFLEFVIDVISFSLQRYCTHFVARPFKSSFPDLKVVIKLFQNATQLLHYQKYTIEIDQILTKIKPLLIQELILLPIAYEGHAIGFIRYKDWFIRCDRGEFGTREGGIIIYHMKHAEQWTIEFIREMLYERQSAEFINFGIPLRLGLEKILTIPIELQLVGNCSWANMEATILAILFVLQIKKGTAIEEGLYSHNLDIYYDWLQYDKARALEGAIQNFEYANPARKATIAMMLGAVLFQGCSYQEESDLVTAKKLMPILTHSDYQYVLKTYLKIYWQQRKTDIGYNLMQVLKNISTDIDWDRF